MRNFGLILTLVLSVCIGLFQACKAVAADEPHVNVPNENNVVISSTTYGVDKISSTVTVEPAPSAVKPQEDRTIDPRISGGRIGVGLNFPGAGVKWFFADRYAVEAKFQYEKTAIATGPRLYRYIGSWGSLFPYLGVEGDYIQFKDKGLKSFGYAAGGFVGGEVYVYRRLSLQFDFGPVYVSLEDRNISIQSGGIGFMVNFGLTYYFGGTGKGR